MIRIFPCYLVYRSSSLVDARKGMSANQMKRTLGV